MSGACQRFIYLPCFPNMLRRDAIPTVRKNLDAGVITNGDTPSGCPHSFEVGPSSGLEFPDDARVQRLEL